MSEIDRYIKKLEIMHRRVIYKLVSSDFANFIEEQKTKQPKKEK